MGETYRGSIFADIDYPVFFKVTNVQISLFVKLLGPRRLPRVALWIGPLTLTAGRQAGERERLRVCYALESVGVQIH
jgi:hypothetical protein